MRVIRFLAVAGAFLCLDTSFLPAQTSVWLDLEGEEQLAATVWKADQAIGSVLLIHGCLKDQTEFEPLPALLHAAGYTVLAYDLYSHGRSRTRKIQIVSQETHDELLGRVSRDAIIARDHLLNVSDSQDLSIVLSGCVAAWATDLIAGSETKRIVLFSGPLHPDAHSILAERTDLAVLGISAQDDVPRMREALGESVKASEAAVSRLIEIQNGGHGAGGILKARGESLVGEIVNWLSSHK